MHARDVYKSMLLDTITPAMRERGFRGGSGKYFLEGDTGHTGSVLLSGNPKRSTAEVAYFQIHYGVKSSFLKEWDAAMGRKPKRPSAWSDHDWLDTVRPPNRDIAGWAVAVTSDAAAVGAEIVSVLDDPVIPAVRASLDDSGLRRAIAACPVGVGLGAPLTLMEISEGNLEVARSRVGDGEDPGSEYLLSRLAEAEALAGWR